MYKYIWQALGEFIKYFKYDKSFINTKKELLILRSDNFISIYVDYL